MWNEVGARGFRVDAVKHFPANFMGDLLDHLHDNGIDPGMIVGEAYDFGASYLNGWIDEVQANMDDDTKAAIDVRVFDFALRNALEQASDAYSYDVRNVFNSSLTDAGGSGFHTVTFVNNHDFRDPGQPVDNDPVLAYAYILTNNKLGIPCVFHPDYYAPLNLHYQIDGLMEAHKRYIFGASQTDYLNRFDTPYTANYISGFDSASLIYQLSYSESGREVIVVINYAGVTLKVDQTINTANIFPGDTLTDIFSVSPYDYQIVDGSNQAYFEVPARSFAVFVEGDLRDDLIDISTPVAIDESNAEWKALKVFPNPVDDVLRMEWNYGGIPLVTVKDIQGRTNSLPVEAGETTIQLDVSSLPAGLYLLEANSNGQIYQSQFIKD
jgi:alpha-amylase